LRRPLIEVAVLLWGAVLLANKVPIVILRIGYSSCVLIMCVGFMYERKKDLTTLKLNIKWMGLIVLILVLGVENHHIQHKKFIEYAAVNKTVELTGLVIEVGKYNSVLMDVDIPSSSKKVHKVLLKPKWGTNQNWKLGDLVHVEGLLQPLESARNPNTFSPLYYYASKGIDLQVDANKVVVDTPMYSKLYTGVGQIQYLIENRLKHVFADTDVPLVSGLLLGDTSGINKDTLSHFRASGTAHVMAVSGLHFGILYMLIFRSLCRLKISFKSAAYLSLLIMFGFVFITGLSFSGLRAFGMMVLHILSIHLKRKYDLLNALGCVAIVTMVSNTYIVWNVGFQLSFWAVFSIGLYSRFKGKLVPNKSLEFVELPLLIYTILMPLTLFHFNQLNLYSVLFNIPVAILMPVTFLLSVISFFLGSVPLLGKTLMFTASAFLESLRSFTGLVARLPLGMFKVGSPKSVLIVCFYAMLCLVFLSIKVRTFVISLFRKKGKALLAVILLTMAFVSLPSHQDHLRIDFLDIGQGDSALLICPSGERLLIDAGPPKANLEQILLKQGVSHLDAVFVSHFDADHYSGLIEISGSIKIDRIYHGQVINKREELRAIKSLYPNTEFVGLGKGDKLSVGPVTIEVLHPERPAMLNENQLNQDKISNRSPSSNDLSLVMLVEYANKSLLFTGDIEEGVESSLSLYNNNRNVPIDVDILKVSHHGSSTSSTYEFLNSFAPEISVIQVGQNFFGHPTKQTINTLSDQDIMVYRNDEQGCIRVIVKNDVIHVIPWLTTYP